MNMLHSSWSMFGKCAPKSDASHALGATQFYAPAGKTQTSRSWKLVKTWNISEAIPNGLYFFGVSLLSSVRESWSISQQNGSSCPIDLLLIQRSVSMAQIPQNASPSSQESPGRREADSLLQRTHHQFRRFWQDRLSLWNSTVVALLPTVVGVVALQAPTEQGCHSMP